MRGALKEWAGDLLSASRLAAQGLIAPGPVARAWTDHQSGAKDWSNELWGVVMIQTWLESLKVQ
jgi:asparagine synthase (glutamine-hydrolysing)